MPDSVYDLKAALDAIDPAQLDYQGWCDVGMALHYEGFDMEVWRDWSMRDGARFNESDFERKWRGFGSYIGTPVTGGTLVKIAKDQGWQPEASQRRSSALSWDSWIGGSKNSGETAVPAQDEPAVVDATLIDENGGEVSPVYTDGNETAELSAFLAALFEPSEIVGYVLDAQEETADETGEVIKYKPGSRGVYSRTAGEITAKLESTTMENALGTLNPHSGAWIRLNPLDGKGVGNGNVADFRFALVESDDMPVAKFAEIVRQMNLPVAALVDSGNKSLHAVVKVDAIDIKQYAERVNLLYSRCEKNGIKVDKQNKNPSRLMRLPGAWRNGRRQFLAGLAQGAGDWDEWCEWYAEATDELPDVVSLASMLGDNLPPLKPALIDGLLRVGHKMLISGPSKAGKSFALISLCIAFAEGGSWFGFKCRKSRALYVNLELDDASCINRFNDVYNALGIPQGNAADIDVWNLRGLSEPMHKLLPKLVRRVKKNRVDVVVIDPIYKVMTGDENSASDMTAFSNLFDVLAREAGVSVIYCHHHSKGFQGNKRSVDRASGSGVFGRDPDAILDMVEIEVDDDARWEFARREFVAECERQFAAEGKTMDWEAIPQEVRNVAAYALENLEQKCSKEAAEQFREKLAVVQKSWPSLTAWRISSTLREFPSTKPIDAWFYWPLHVVDPALADRIEAGGEEPRKNRKADKKKPKKSHRDKIDEAIEYAVGACADDGVEPTRKNVFDRLPSIDGKKVSRDTFTTWTKPSSRASSWMCDTSKSGSGMPGILVLKTGGKDGGKLD